MFEGLKLRKKFGTCDLVITLKTDDIKLVARYVFPSVFYRSM